MKIERTKNATRNVVFGVFLKLYQILVPFLLRTAMIYFMGMQYVGLNSLFSSVLQVLNLAELGVGSAMIFSMYKPIANDDKITICALMKLYKLYYRIIGLVIAAVGLILTPFIPHLIHGSVPDVLNVYVLYLLNLGATVLSYWLFAYKNSILQAHQRDDIVSKVTLITSTIQYIIQILVLAILKNYYVYVIVLLIGQVVTNIVIAIVSVKLYPEYKPVGNLDKSVIKEINGRIKDLFTAKLGGTVVNSADTIVISSFLGLTKLAVYQNYYFILTAVIGVISVVFQAVTAGIGNSLVTETMEKNYSDFRCLTFFITWLTTVCTCCLACMYQPFMRIWVGEEHMFSYFATILFCIYFYISILQRLACVYKDAAGIWHEDRFRPLIGALVNLVFNLVFVKFWGIYAILLSTIFSYLTVAMPWLIHNLFTILFKRSFKQYVFEMFKNAVLAILITAISVSICYFIKFEGKAYLIICALVSIIVSNVLLIVVNRKNEMFIPMINLVNKVTKGKFAWILNKIK